VKCPFCGYEEDRVIDTRQIDDGTTIRRRRECLKCLRRFTTYEKIETIPVMVIKKDKSRQPFNRDKILTGLMRACEKRPVSVSDLENIVNEIESYIYNSTQKEITSREIGEMVMAKLKELDEVAYVRFASVYRQFTDLNSFMTELRKILDEKNHN
jgi:transcriptional repressor NrdR